MPDCYNTVRAVWLDRDMRETRAKQASKLGTEYDVMGRVYLVPVSMNEDRITSANTAGWAGRPARFHFVPFLTDQNLPNRSRKGSFEHTLFWIGEKQILQVAAAVLLLSALPLEERKSYNGH
jgi:hypothetical protein